MSKYVIGEAVTRLDASIKNGGAFLGYQLETMLKESVRQPALPLSAFRYIPMDNKIVKDGSTSWKYRVVTSYGSSTRLVTGDEELKRVGATYHFEDGVVINDGAVFGWNHKQIKEAAFSGVPLQDDMLTSAREQSQAFINDIAWHGDVSAGCYGVLSNQYVPKYTLSAQITSATSAADAISILSGIVNSIYKISKCMIIPDHLLLPTGVDAVVSNLYLSGTSKNVVSALKESHKNKYGVELIVGCAPELDGAGDNGEDICFTFKSDKSVLMIPVPLAFEILPVQYTNLRYDFPVNWSAGTAMIRKPLGCAVGAFPLN